MAQKERPEYTPEERAVMRRRLGIDNQVQQAQQSVADLKLIHGTIQRVADKNDAIEMTEALREHLPRLYS